MACARCGGFLVSERWRGFVDNAREMDLQNMRCVNCGCIDDPVIVENRLTVERSMICCTTR
jgi:hypothetical protein